MSILALDCIWFSSFYVELPILLYVLLISFFSSLTISVSRVIMWLLACCCSGLPFLLGEGKKKTGAFMSISVLDSIQFGGFCAELLILLYVLFLSFFRNLFIELYMSTCLLLRAIFFGGKKKGKTTSSFMSILVFNCIWFSGFYVEILILLDRDTIAELRLAMRELWQQPVLGM
jgi:hypothetical protein